MQDGQRSNQEIDSPAELRKGHELEAPSTTEEQEREEVKSLSRGSTISSSLGAPLPHTALSLEM